MRRQTETQSQFHTLSIFHCFLHVLKGVPPQPHHWLRHYWVFLSLSKKISSPLGISLGATITHFTFNQTFFLCQQTKTSLTVKQIRIKPHFSTYISYVLPTLQDKFLHMAMSYPLPQAFKPQISLVL